MRSALQQRVLARALVATAVVVASVSFTGATAEAAQPPVGLGTAGSFAVLAGAGITNTNATTITGDVGTFPNTSETGFGSVTLNGTDHAGDAVTQQAKADLVTAYDDAAGRTPATAVATELGGTTLGPGVYSSGTFGITGTLTLDGPGVYIFQAESTLITATGSSVSLINGANSCNVYWKVPVSATIETGSDFVGTILALQSIQVKSGATIDGRALARNASVTLDNNTIIRSSCTDTTTTVASSKNPSSVGGSVTFRATVTATSGPTPTGSVEFLDNGVTLGVAPLDTNGQASLTTAALGAGSHPITAVYVGATGLSASGSSALLQIVAVPSGPTFAG
jgi:hypothetical protein